MEGREVNSVLYGHKSVFSSLFCIGVSCMSPIISSNTVTLSVGKVLFLHRRKRGPDIPVAGYA